MAATAKKQNPAIPFGLAVVGGAVSALSQLNAIGASWAYQAGANAPLSLIIWAGLYYGVLRNRSWKMGGLLLLTIISTVILVSVGVGAIQKAQFRKATSEIATDYARFKNGESLSTSAQPAIGDAGQLAAVMHNAMQTGLEDRRNYDSAINATGILSILPPRSPYTETDFRRDQDKIRNARDAVTKYQQLNFKHLDDERASISNSSISDGIKRSALEGFDRSSPARRSQFKQIWNDENQMVTEIEGISKLLFKNRGAWLTRNGRIVFLNSKTLSAYNHLILSINVLSNDEKAVRHSVTSSMDQGLRSMNALANQ